MFGIIHPYGTNKTRMMTNQEEMEERFGTKDLISTFATP
jgi:hypothetical protein